MSPLAGAAQHETTGRAPSARPASDLRAGSVGVRQTAGETSSSPAVVFLELPLPPSTNNLFQNRRGKGRSETAQYRDWKGHAGWRLRQQHPASIHGEVLILLNIERSNMAADIDNRVKALFDLLVKHQVIDDDKHVIGFCIAWAPPGNGLARLGIMPAANIIVEFQLANDPGHGGWFMSAPQLEQET